MDALGVRAEAGRVAGVVNAMNEEYTMFILLS